MSSPPAGQKAIFYAETQPDYDNYEDVKKFINEKKPQLLSVDFRPPEGDFPLHHAVEAGRLAVVRAILDSAGMHKRREVGLNTGMKAFPVDENHERKASLYPPLIVAIRTNHLDIATHLLNMGATKNPQLGRGGVTAYHNAAKINDYAVLEFQLSNGTDVDLLPKRGADFRTPEYSTALHLAAANETPDLEVIKLLLNHGANPNGYPKSDSTPLHLLSIKASDAAQEAIKLLLQNSANINATNNLGKTPLELALNRVALDVGDSPTPEELTTRKNLLPTVQFLYKNGANLGSEEDPFDHIKKNEILSELFPDIKRRGTTGLGNTALREATWGKRSLMVIAASTAAIALTTIKLYPIVQCLMAEEEEKVDTSIWDSFYSTPTPPPTWSGCFSNK